MIQDVFEKFTELERTITTEYYFLPTIELFGFSSTNDITGFVNTVNTKYHDDFELFEFNGEQEFNKLADAVIASWKIKYTPDEYQKECLVTWNRNLTKEDERTNAILGFAEIHEIFDHQKDSSSILDIADELGDFWYYVAVACHSFDLNFNEILSYCKRHENVDFVIDKERAYGYFCNLAGCAKKLHYHKKPYEDLQKRIKSAILDLSYVIYNEYNNYVPLHFVWAYNIHKLRERHGTSFKENTN